MWVRGNSLCEGFLSWEYIWRKVGWGVQIGEVQRIYPYSASKEFENTLLFFKSVVTD